MGHAVTRDAGVGAEIGGVLGLLAGLSLFAMPGLGFIAGAGWLTGIFTGAGIDAVAGGLVGVLTHLGIPATDAAYYNEGIRRRGVLVAVRTQDNAVTQVAQMLNRAGAVNIEERAGLYRREGLVVRPASRKPQSNKIKACPIEIGQALTMQPNCSDVEGFAESAQCVKKGWTVWCTIR